MATTQLKPDAALHEILKGLQDLQSYLKTPAQLNKAVANPYSFDAAMTNPAPISSSLLPKPPDPPDLYQSYPIYVTNTAQVTTNAPLLSNLPSKTRTGMLPLKFSCEEIYERMENGLCIFCEELDIPGHNQLKHKGFRIFFEECDDPPSVESAFEENYDECMDKSTERVSVALDQVEKQAIDQVDEHAKTTVADYYSRLNEYHEDLAILIKSSNNVERLFSHGFSDSHISNLSSLEMVHCISGINCNGEKCSKCLSRGDRVWEPGGLSYQPEPQTYHVNGDMLELVSKLHKMGLEHNTNAGSIPHNLGFDMYSRGDILGALIICEVATAFEKVAKTWKFMLNKKATQSDKIPRTHQKVCTTGKFKLEELPKNERWLNVFYLLGLMDLSCWNLLWKQQKCLKSWNFKYKCKVSSRDSKTVKPYKLSDVLGSTSYIQGSVDNAFDVLAAMTAEMYPIDLDHIIKALLFHFSACGITLLSYSNLKTLLVPYSKLLCSLCSLSEADQDKWSWPEKHYNHDDMLQLSLNLHMTEVPVLSCLQELGVISHKDYVLNLFVRMGFHNMKFEAAVRIQLLAQHISRRMTIHNVLEITKPHEMCSLLSLKTNSEMSIILLREIQDRLVKATCALAIITIQSDISFDDWVAQEVRRSCVGIVYEVVAEIFKKLSKSWKLKFQSQYEMLAKESWEEVATPRDVTLTCLFFPRDAPLFIPQEFVTTRFKGKFEKRILTGDKLTFAEESRKDCIDEEGCSKLQRSNLLKSEQELELPIVPKFQILHDDETKLHIYDFEAMLLQAQSLEMFRKDWTFKYKPEFLLRVLLKAELEQICDCCDMKSHTKHKHFGFDRNGFHNDIHGELLVPIKQSVGVIDLLILNIHFHGSKSQDTVDFSRVNNGMRKILCDPHNMSLINIEDGIHKTIAIWEVSYLQEIILKGLLAGGFEREWTVKKSHEWLKELATAVDAVQRYINHIKLHGTPHEIFSDRDPICLKDFFQVYGADPRPAATFEFVHVQPNLVHFPSSRDDIVQAHELILVKTMFTCHCKAFSKALVQWKEHPPPKEATWELFYRLQHTFKLSSLRTRMLRTGEYCDRIMVQLSYFRFNILVM